MRILNGDKQKNLNYLKELVSKGYTDRGWANGGQDFTRKIKPDDEMERIDCSLYQNRGTNEVIVNHTLKEFIHVDMSD